MNRLVQASSPYLLQHADNPVDWYEWGDDAFSEARGRDRPVLLSVGYSACHWCHVMAHESFEDETTAAYMNEHFVNVKVDREERPDVDRIYMDALQTMTGRGGWPMTVFLTPDGRPFFAGTYFPREPRGHHPTFMQIMQSVTDAWADRRGDLESQADRLTDAVNRSLPPGTIDLDPARLLEHGTSALIAQFDADYGGFGGAPKFPQAPNLELLARAIALAPEGPQAESARTVLDHTLRRMADGGIYDHLGGGFARYAVDRIWLVPHFEKMLYDNALLARIYLRGWQLLDQPRYRTVAEETIEYLLRDMRDPAGGIHSAEDADSDGVEGKYYVFSMDEFEDILGPEAALMADVYGVTVEGNFEGSNVLHRPTSLDTVAAQHEITRDQLDAIRQRADELLRSARRKRNRPGRDDKVVTAWNGLALRTLAEAAAVLGHRHYLQAAIDLATFATTELRQNNGRLVRSWRRGQLGVPGFCDDYAGLALGLYALYQTTGDPHWFTEAERLADEMIELFADPDGDGFFATSKDAERLIARPKNFMDNPTPSDNALAAEVLQVRAALTGNPAMLDYLLGVSRAAARIVEQYPSAAGHLVAVLASSPINEVAIVGPDPESRSPLEAEVWARFRPNAVIASGDGSPSPVPLLSGRTSTADGPLAYVCRDFVCELPVSEPAQLRRQLG